MRYEKECSVRRDLLNQLTEAKGNIRVLARVRPMQENEDASPLECTDEWTLYAPLSTFPTASTTTPHPPSLSSSLSAPSLSSMTPSNSTTTATSSVSNASSSLQTSSILNKKYQFDRVFGPHATQEDIFGEVATLSSSLLDGFNCCLFAYGQTGSGKTYTMEGPAEDRGLNYRLLENVFKEIHDRSATTQYDLHVSIMEIYNEAIVDLLDEKLTAVNSSVSNGGLKMRQGERGICVPDATRTRVTNLSQIEEAMDTAKRVRAVASTDMNEHSSRSHCVTCIEVCGRKTTSSNQVAVAGGQNSQNISSTNSNATILASKTVSDNESSIDTVTYSRLFLVDLAGSERIAQSGAQGKALDEAKHINKSLSALARVMECLQLKRQHIPFRDSTLTYLLKDSLLEAKTVMVLNLSPSAVSYGQSINSLNFGIRVRKIERSAPKKNFDIDRDRINASKQEMENELKILREEAKNSKIEAKNSKLESNRLSAQLTQVKLDAQAEIQAMQSKHTEVVAQLKLQATQTAQAHSAEISALLSSHAQEIAALKKQLAESQANATKLAEIQKKALLASSRPHHGNKENFVNEISTLAAPAPVVLASAIVSQQKPISIASKSELEDIHKDKYTHSSTPLKSKSSITAIVSTTSTATVPVTPKNNNVLNRTKSANAAVMSPSKLSSPKVVVDELQKMYLQQLSRITSPAMNGPIDVPTMGPNGVLQPVVVLLTPQVARTNQITIANASSPLPFNIGPATSTTTLNGSITSTISANDSSIIEAKGTDGEGNENFATPPPCILDDDSYLSIPSDSTLSSIETIESSSRAVSAKIEQAPNNMNNSEANNMTNSISTSHPDIAVQPTQVASNASDASSKESVNAISTVSSSTNPTASASVAQQKTGKTWPHRGCLMDRRTLAVDRIKKKVTFSEQQEYFDGGDPLLPIRQRIGASLPVPASRTASSTSNSTVLSTSMSTKSTSGPASPIKSVAVRPSISSATPGARRVVAKSTLASSASTSSSASSTALKPTPGRVRPVGRIGQPLSGPSSVYKIY